MLYIVVKSHTITTMLLMCYVSSSQASYFQEKISSTLQLYTLHCIVFVKLRYVNREEPQTGFYSATS